MNQIRQFLAQLTLKQKLIYAGVFVAVVALLFGGARWQKERDMKPLFTELAPEDAGAVVAKLRAANVEYRVADGGTILVPSARVAELRIDMASAGIPKTGRLGYELFDKQNFGASEFDEQVMFHRALEGELERSVMTLNGVETARVHVTFPKESVFSDLRQPAKASVLVKLRPGTSLRPQNVAAIERLAASAVEGLQPENVSVVDMNGNLLRNSKLELDGDNGASSATLEFRQLIERDLSTKIRATLDPLLGSEKYRAGVTVECDFTSGEQSEESFDPDRSVMVSSQRSEDAAGSTSASGIPGTASNLPRPIPPSSGGRGAVSRKSENVTYQTSRLVRHLKLPQGALRRISVAVLMDQALHWEGAGPAAKRILDPPSADKLKVVHDVVAGVVGIQPERGDQVLVDSLPFDATLAIPPPPAPPAPPKGSPGGGAPGHAPGLDQGMQRLKTIPPVWLGAGLCLLVVLMVALAMGLRFVLRRLKKPKPVEAQTVSEVSAALPAGSPDAAKLPAAEGQFNAKAMAQIEENLQAQESAQEEALQSLKLIPSTRKAEVFKKFIAEETRKDPGRVAQLLRSWLNGEAA
jgi:flagellar M-ring protein FliF